MSGIDDVRNELKVKSFCLWLSVNFLPFNNNTQLYTKQWQHSPLLSKVSVFPSPLLSSALPFVLFIANFQLYLIWRKLSDKTVTESSSDSDWDSELISVFTLIRCCVYNLTKYQVTSIKRSFKAMKNFCTRSYNSKIKQSNCRHLSEYLSADIKTYRKLCV